MTVAKRALGSTGIDVSCLGLGTVKFGRNQEVKYPSSFALPSDREVEQLLAAFETWRRPMVEDEGPRAG